MLRISHAMKSLYLSLFVSALFLGCGHADHDHTSDQQAGEAIENDTNGALLSEVMKIHDEGMEKMDVIQRSKTSLKAKLESATTGDKAAIEMDIAKLDSADKGMMDWMHHFKMEQDTLSDEEYREYLESELIKVKKVREGILQALKGANE